MPRRDLQITFAVPDERGAWADRMEGACRILERAFPTEDLRVATPERGDVALVRDRLAFFETRLRTRKRWFSLHSGDPNLGERCDRRVTFEGYEPRGSLDDFVTIGGRMGSVEGLYSLSVVFPERSWGLHESLLVELGDATRAFTAHLSPRQTEARLWRLQLLAGSPPVIPSGPEAALPTLAYTAYGGLVAAEQPGFAGWLNYWSEASARFLGFPDARRDADLLSHSYRTPVGSWLVKLGPEPLDCFVASHVALLASVYERFPKLGVRVARRTR